MSLEFKKIEVNSIQEMLPFYAMRHNIRATAYFWRAMSERLL